VDIVDCDIGEGATWPGTIWSGSKGAPFEPAMSCHCGAGGMYHVRSHTINVGRK